MGKRPPTPEELRSERLAAMQPLDQLGQGGLDALYQPLWDRLAEDANGPAGVLVVERYAERLSDEQERCEEAIRKIEDQIEAHEMVEAMLQRLVAQLGELATLEEVSRERERLSWLLQHWEVNPRPGPIVAIVPAPGSRLFGRLEPYVQLGRGDTLGSALEAEASRRATKAQLLRQLIAERADRAWQLSVHERVLWERQSGTNVPPWSSPPEEDIDVEKSAYIYAKCARPYIDRAESLAHAHAIAISVTAEGELNEEKLAINWRKDAASKRDRVRKAWQREGYQPKEGSDAEKLADLKANIKKAVDRE